MIGRVVAGRFQLLAEAGSGGMGTVYRARDLTDGATVAVKILNGREVREMARFDQEAAILSGLAHPAIVRYLANGIAESGERFIAMEWLRRRGPGDAPRAQAGRRSPRRWRWRGGRPTRSPTRTSAASSTATSSPRTCSSPTLAIERLKVLDFGIARLTRGRAQADGDRVA